MKNKIKRHGKIGILVFGISLLLWNCEKDNEINNQAESREFTAKKIKTQEIEENNVVFEQVSEIKNFLNQSNKKSTNGNQTYDIDMNEAMYIEYDNGTYHSYTFSIENLANNHNLENIILSLQEDGSYKAFLTTYTFTEEERIQFNNGVDIDLSDKSTIQEIDYADLNIENKSSGCSYEQIEIDVEIACGIDGCWESQYTTWETITAWALVCSGGGEGGGGNTGPGNPNTGGGGGNTNNPFPNGPGGSVVTIPTNPDGSSAVPTILTNTLQSQLTTAQSRWINSHNNGDEVLSLFNYLQENQNSVEAKNFVLVMIDFYRENNWKELLRQAVANGVTSTAELTHKIYTKLSAIAQAHPSSITYINSVVDEFREIADDAFDTSPQTLDWSDLFGIWLFELGNYPTINGTDTIIFDGDDTTTENLKQQEGVNEARNEALIKIQNNDISEPVNEGWTYGQGEFYDGMSNGNIATSFLGSYNTRVDITQNQDGTYTLTFTVSNPSTWESATRLRIDNDGDNNHDGIFPNTTRPNQHTTENPINSEINIGGTINQTWTWTETIL